MKLEQFLLPGFMAAGTLISAIILCFGIWSSKNAHKAEKEKEILDLISQKEDLQQKYDNIQGSNIRTRVAIGEARENRRNRIGNRDEQQESANRLLQTLRERQRMGFGADDPYRQQRINAFW